jgi:nitrate/nitrite-specific signal transduction histidine kinase
MSNMMVPWNDQERMTKRIAQKAMNIRALITKEGEFAELAEKSSL